MTGNIHKNNYSSLKGKKIFITGASGFIGGRLVERLVLDEGAEVVALVHQYRNAVRLARFPVQMVQGDVADAECVAKAAQGCDAIVHAAVSFAGSSEQNHRITLEGARNVCEVASKQGARLVHFSTFSVYGTTPAGELTEESPKNPEGDAYGSSKLEAELLVQKYQEKGMMATILQPAVVYGPWSFWSSHAAGLISKGTLMLPAVENGLCNAVYVDDVVEAVILCLKLEKCPAGPFLISDSAPVKWSQFFAAHAKNPLAASIREMTADELAELTPKPPAPEPLTLRTILPKEFRFHLKGAILEFPGFKWLYRKTIFLRWFNRLARQILVAPKKQDSHQEQAKVQANESETEVSPSRDHIPLFQSRTSISIEKAAKELGFKPKFKLDSGAILTRAWLEWANKYN